MTSQDFKTSTTFLLYCLTSDIMIMEDIKIVVITIIFKMAETERTTKETERRGHPLMAEERLHHL